MQTQLKPFLTFAHAVRARGLLWQEKKINWLSRIYTIRGVKVMLEADLAEIYGYETRFFNRQVKNSIDRFAEDFRFQLSEDEMQNLMCKKCTSSWGGTRKLLRNVPKGIAIWIFIEMILILCGAAKDDNGDVISKW